MSIIKRLISLAVPVLVLGVLINEIVSTPIYTDRELAAFRERDLELARRGEFDESLRALKALTEIEPNDPLVWGDYLTVLIWAHRERDAVAAAQQPDVPLLPAYALAELFEAALRLGDLPAAQHFAIAEIGRSDQPEKVAVVRVDRMREVGGAAAEPFIGPLIEAGLKRVPASGPLLARIDAPAPPPVAEEVPAPAPPAPAPVPVAPVAAKPAAARPSAAPRHAGAARGDTSRAFAKPHPRRAEPLPAPRGPSESIPNFVEEREQAAPAGAVRLSAAPAPTAVSVAGERARQAVQAAEQAPAGEPRHTLAKSALAEVDNYIDQLHKDAPDDAGALRNAQLDRVRALTLAGRPDQAAALFESLGDPSGFPVYGLLNGADAYSRLHQPERARPLLDLAQAQAPDDPSVLAAVFYSQLDDEHYDLAAETLKKLQAVAGPDVVDGRTSWVARLDAMFDAYRNRLDEAQQKLEALRVRALNDPELDLNLATVYRWRGWARRALPEYEKARADGADPVVARVGIANTQLDLQRFAQADVTLSHVRAAAPEHPDVIDLQKRWDWFNRYEYIAQVQAGRSTESRINGSGDLTFDQWLYSKPIDNNYRVFVHHHYDWADFDEGAGHTHRIGVGVDYRSEPYDVAVSVEQRSPGGKRGANISGEYRPDDHWGFFAEARSDSDQIPLRAIRADEEVDGPSYTVGARYRWDETRNARIAYTFVDIGGGEYRNGSSFEDDQRQSVMATIEQQVYRDEHQRVALTGDLYYSRNSAGDDVPYFNPSSDKAVQLGLDYLGVLRRRYDRVWTHRITTGLGLYEQEGESTTPIYSIQYEQRWEFGPAFSVNYGAMYRSRVYDGDREGYAAVFGGIRWRF